MITHTCSQCLPPIPINILYFYQCLSQSNHFSICSANQLIYLRSSVWIRTVYWSLMESLVYIKRKAILCFFLNLSIVNSSHWLLLDISLHRSSVGNQLLFVIAIAVSFYNLTSHHLSQYFLTLAFSLTFFSMVSTDLQKDGINDFRNEHSSNIYCFHLVQSKSLDS